MSFRLGHLILSRHVCGSLGTIRIRLSSNTFLKLSERIPQLLDQVANLQISICRFVRAASQKYFDLTFHRVPRFG